MQLGQYPVKHKATENVKTGWQKMEDRKREDQKRTIVIKMQYH